jgi:hypothetical protein
MNEAVRRDWDKANTFLPAINAALASIPFGALGVLEIASQEEDEKYATDYLLKLGVVSVGARIRGTYALRSYADFTIRSRRDSGAMTELDKWKLGIYPDRYFYGWGDDAELTAWVFVDVGSVVARGLHLDRPNIPNGDGTYFVAISLEELGVAVLAVSDPPPMSDLKALLMAHVRQ